MCIRIDHAFHSLLFCKRPPTPIEIETLWRRVDLDPGSGCGSGIEDRRNIDLIRFTFEQKAPRRMSEHGDKRIFHCPDDAFGHVCFAQIKNRVNRRHCVIEIAQNLVGEIKRTVAENVALDSGKETKAIELLV